MRPCLAAGRWHALDETGLNLGLNRVIGMGRTSAVDSARHGIRTAVTYRRRLQACRIN
jgi:hypothetical protein